jgi:putative ABC transport system permease protein
MSIFNTTDVIIENARIEFNSMVQIRPQSRQMGGSAGNNTTSTVSVDDLRNFSESEYLSGWQLGAGGGFARGNETIFYLKSPDMLAAFEAEMREKGLPDDWRVFRDEAAYNRMLKPIESLKDVSLTFLLIVLIFGASIMILLSVIAIRERKYEIGVLRAMGLKKQKVALCLWVETIAITFVCFVTGIFVGTALANPVSNALWTGDGQISIALDWVTTIQILGVTVLLASIAGAVSVSRITKYEPIKILMERN